MKTLNVISAIVFLGLLFLSSPNYAQINVDNNTCHSMFVTATWGPYCTPCTGCNASGVIAANSSGTIGTSGPTGTDILLNLTARLNNYSACTPTQNAWELCNGDALGGKSDCCATTWQVYRNSGTIIVDP